MGITKQQAADYAITDLAKRIGVSPAEIHVAKSDDTQFANGALGAPVEGEMAPMMMTNGWRIILRVPSAGADYEYRADARQVRLFRYQGANHKIYP